MKAISTYINEKLIIGNNLKGYKYYPKDKYELIKAIQDKINKEGLGTKDKPLDLNDIDTFKIIDMTHLFDPAYGKLSKLSLNGYFDISNWDVSNVKNMHSMFYHSKFNGNISEWDVSNVKYMGSMFLRSKFNGDISNWDVNNVENMRLMFYGCPLQKNPPKWYKE